MSPRLRVPCRRFLSYLPVSASPRLRASHPDVPSLSLSSLSPVSDIVKAAILDTGYENALKSENTDEAEARLENLQELVNAAVDYDEQGVEGLRDFIDHSALVSDADQYKHDAPVTLMTAHSAKGLEFPLVFIVGLEDGLFPLLRLATDEAELEEERRLCYVAMTAPSVIYMSTRMKRRVYGEEMASEPSHFLMRCRSTYWKICHSANPGSHSLADPPPRMIKTRIGKREQSTAVRPMTASIRSRSSSNNETNNWVGQPPRHVTRRRSNGPPRVRNPRPPVPELQQRHPSSAPQIRSRLLAVTRRTVGTRSPSRRSRRFTETTVTFPG